MRTLLVALVVVLASGSAWAKPKVAILGLEASGGAAAVAKDVTSALRDRAKAGTGSHVLAPSSDREQVDLKLLNNCENEAPACMAKIGTDLGADVLVFGRVEKTDKGYVVKIKVLDVNQKKIDRLLDDTLAAGDASGTGLQTWAKRAYGRLLL